MGPFSERSEGFVNARYTGEPTEGAESSGADSPLALRDHRQGPGVRGGWGVIDEPGGGIEFFDVDDGVDIVRPRSDGGLGRRHGNLQQQQVAEPG